LRLLVVVTNQELVKTFPVLDVTELDPLASVPQGVIFSFSISAWPMFVASVKWFAFAFTRTLVAANDATPNSPMAKITNPTMTSNKLYPFWFFNFSSLFHVSKNNR
jgi:hypothetical protein